METAKDIGGRFVLNHFWDAEEPRLVVVEAKTLPLISADAGPGGENAVAGAGAAGPGPGGGARGGRRRRNSPVYADKHGVRDKVDYLVSCRSRFLPDFYKFLVLTIFLNSFKFAILTAKLFVVSNIYNFKILPISFKIAKDDILPEPLFVISSTYRELNGPWQPL
jgi:hypothetical protein